jgi:hypothetical protein
MRVPHLSNKFELYLQETLILLGANGPKCLQGNRALKIPNLFWAFSKEKQKHIFTTHLSKLVNGRSRNKLEKILMKVLLSQPFLNLIAQKH